MKVFMTGGTGFVGTNLTEKLTRAGHEVTILARSTRGDRLLPGVSFIEGNPTKAGPWQDSAADHEVFINLAGAPIFQRWTQSAKQTIRDSRITTTQNLVKALEARKGRETRLLSTSAIGYYGFQEDNDLDERSPSGEGFLASVTQEWESSALEAEQSGMNVSLLRFGVVLGRHGGALHKMIPLFKWYLGSPLGSGRQWFSWIHQEDLSEIFLYLLDRREMTGPINCTAPHPVRNREMTRILGEVLGKATFMPAVPGFLIKLILGEFGSVFLKGQKVLPKRLLDAGFSFRFPMIEGALQNLLG
ncbi:MAG: TIGR01777 family oxidoreductase [Proteobacteria bacterium]|nr:TIGR01777 family oxidoreductase [Pseudomonadota bacterium]